MSAASPAVILLCAGRGTRMRPLTEHVPKCLLPVGDRLVIDHLLDAVFARSTGQVVLVTGFASEAVRAHVDARHGRRVVFAHNDRFDSDVNILSVETGVAGLVDPGSGYLVVETDLLLDAAAWDKVFGALATGESFWVTHGTYSTTLTGGIVHADSSGRIDAVEYQPVYDPAFEGWPKMVGLLGVGAREVQADRELRQAAMAASIAQYYLAPWRTGIARLPCRVVPIDGCYARSFNTVEDFAAAQDEYLAVLASTRQNQES